MGFEAGLESHAEEAEHGSQAPQWVLGHTVEGAGDALPPKFPFIKDELTGEVCEVTLLFVTSKYLIGKRFKPNTVGAYTSDLLDWMRYGARFSIPWDKATWADLDRYLDSMDLYSPHHGQVFSAKTQARRLTPIKGMYEWAAENFPELCTEAPRGTLLLPKSVADFLDDKRKELRARVDVAAQTPAAPNVMQPHEVRAVLDLMGPAPEPLTESNEKALNAADSSIGHLGFEMGFQAGLRVGEVVDMPLKLFLKYVHAKIEPGRHYDIGPFRRKGGKFKSVKFHGVLLQKVVDYINGERNLAMRGRKVDHGTLLVHKSACHRGLPIRASTLQRRFTRACIKAGLTRGVQRVRAVDDDWKNVETVVEQRSAFSFHDLRHSFAVWTYYARKRFGDAEPWKYVQEQLGHEDVLTTLKTYLKVAGDFEAYVSDKFVGSLNAMAGINQEGPWGH